MRTPPLVLSATSFFCLSLLAGARDPNVASAPSTKPRATPEAHRSTHGSLNGLDRRRLRSAPSEHAQAWSVAETSAPQLVP